MGAHPKLLVWLRQWEMQCHASASRYLHYSVDVYKRHLYFIIYSEVPPEADFKMYPSQKKRPRFLMRIAEEQ